MAEHSPILGYLFIPDGLGPPDPTEAERLTTAGAEQVYTDWGTREYRALVLAQAESGSLHQLLLKGLEDLGDRVEEIRSLLLSLQTQGVAVRLVDEQGALLSDSTQAWIDRMGDLPAALHRRRALHRNQTHRWQGKPPPGAAPFGYRRDLDRYGVDRKQAAMVRGFFEHFLLYGSLRSAVRHLQQQYGKTISVSTGRRWLTHPVYRGDLEFRDGTILRDTHAPILTRQEAAQIDRWLRRNRQLPRRSASAPRSLAGLVLCHDCGSSLRIVQTTRRARSHTYLYLRCPTCRYSLTYETLLQQVIQQICDQLPQRTTRFDPEPLTQLRSSLEAQLNQNETNLKQLSELEQQGLLDAASLQKRRYQIQAQNTRLLQQMEQLPPENLQEIAQTLSIQPFWQDLTESERRSYFREFLCSIAVNPQGLLQLQFLF